MRGRRTVIVSACDIATRLGSAVRRIAGMPDYRSHLEHLRQTHPELPVPSERQFYLDYIAGRYGDGPTRCC
jgi:uncharacterized short protein YbdD (DUF466 family)